MRFSTWNWGNSSHRRYSRRIPHARSKRKIAPMLKRLNSPRRLISFFELLGAYIGVRLWTPGRQGNKDLIWLAIPTVTDNLGNDFMLSKHYTTERPTSWMLQESAAHSLAANTTIVAKHMKGDSAKWSIWEEISIDSCRQIYGINKGYQFGQTQSSG